MSGEEVFEIRTKLVTQRWNNCLSLKITWTPQVIPKDNNNTKLRNLWTALKNPALDIKLKEFVQNSKNKKKNYIKNK